MFMPYIGAGGWAYFKVPGMDSLTAYSKAFDFVEVNSTFYETPSIEMVRSWRQRVPDNFMFSVRCHKDLTHKYLLSPGKECYEILNQSLRICGELKAEILHIQTPPTFNPDEKCKSIQDLLSSVDFGNVRLAWEIRGKVSDRTIELMRDLGIIHCTDISREMPAVDSDIIYTRLFGHGKHNLYQFYDAELLKIDTNAKERGKDNIYLTFHGVKMYSEAARLKVFEKSGTFPKVSKATGLASLKIVLEEDTVFPATKSELIEKQGWKVFDLTENEHVHASMLLEKLPDSKYSSVEEVICDLE
ncbi:MAG: DUF72 domain-containing protein (plasmid) [Candidatus Methanoperedens sp.]|nr:MAG: DUF72 domain-containing protein [Candidatus Methanoperedens sp.]